MTNLLESNVRLSKLSHEALLEWSLDALLELRRLQADTTNQSDWYVQWRTCEQEVKELKEQRDRLEKALRWYVETDEVSDISGNEFWLDGRDRAIAALASIGGEGL